VTCSPTDPGPAPHRSRGSAATARIALLGVLLGVVVGGCSYVHTAYSWVGGITTGMRVESISANPVHLASDFDVAVCSTDPYVEGSIWLTDVPVADLVGGSVEKGQILHLELLWTPRPGYTPIDFEATNLSVRYIVISEGEYGIYEGGGFGYPLGSPEGSSMILNVEGVTLQLAESTDGFVDLLSPAVLAGTFNGPCDVGLAELIRDAAAQLVTDAFGRTMFVRLD
tara:strand:- start:1838 stop:2515 length:678 start_codon:yes stop_codon:yes gene_type:complete